MILAAWRGHEAQALELIEATSQEAASRRWTSDNYARSVLYNGLGRHADARDAAWEAFQPDPIGYGVYLVPELAEAASRTGDRALLEAALEWLSDRTRVISSCWASGIEARVRALLSEGDVAEALYRESVAHLSGTRVRLELARTHLLYGEWLRRERRRRDARKHLRTALEAYTAMGVEAFARRAERELLATGERARKRTVDTLDQLTPQETQIARLVADGYTNREIAGQLFISASTVEYHLRKAFRKLGVKRGRSSRSVRSSSPLGDGAAGLTSASKGTDRVPHSLPTLQWPDRKNTIRWWVRTKDFRDSIAGQSRHDRPHSPLSR
jgi:DNA-binding CsgD family transcriptional regulator